MFVCICRKISEQALREVSTKINTYFPTKSGEQKLELVNIEFGQPTCGSCRGYILTMLESQGERGDV